jgi:hypothetical protein
MQVRTESAVTTKDLLVDDGRHWQTVEAVGECFPQLDVVPPFACLDGTGSELVSLVRGQNNNHNNQILTLVIEAINAIDGSTFVIPAQQEKVFRVLNFVRQQETNCFQRLFSAIHIITQK